MRLEDDDFDLIEENLGVKLKKRKKFSRLRTVSSDEEQSDEDAEDRDAIRNQLFQDDDDAATSVSSMLCCFVVFKTTAFK